MLIDHIQRLQGSSSKKLLFYRHSDKWLLIRTNTFDKDLIYTFYALIVTLSGACNRPKNNILAYTATSMRICKPKILFDMVLRAGYAQAAEKSICKCSDISESCFDCMQAEAPITCRQI